MFFKKRTTVKTEADRNLMISVYQVRDNMAQQRALLATFRDVDEAAKVQLHTQEALFDFLYREARLRHVSGDLVSEMSAAHMQAESQTIIKEP